MLIKYTKMLSLAIACMCITSLSIAQLPTKVRYQLPKNISADSYEKHQIWIKVKAQYKEAFKTSNPLSTVIEKLAAKPVTQLFPETPKKLALHKVKPNTIDLTTIYHLDLHADIDVVTAVNQVLATGMVEIAEPVPVHKMYYTPNDSDIAQQNYLRTIKAFDAWEISKGDTSVVVGIVDSGFDFNHPDLKNKVAYNWNDPIDGIDNDNDGYIDNFQGWDFVGESLPASNLISDIIEDNNPQLTSPGIDHGISVAGCAAADTDNGIGVAGSGFNVRILATKHSADDSPESLSIIRGYEGVKYLAEQGVKIINCSWGGEFPSDIGELIIREAIDDYGCLIIVAAGNDGKNIKQYPASYDGVISVGSTTATDIASDFTNYDYTVDIMAPGSFIYATHHVDGQEYAFTQGTSFSSPIVAGAAALVWSHRPELTPRQIGELLRITADPVDTRNNEIYNGKMGVGRLNMLRALTENAPAIRYNNAKFVSVQSGGLPLKGEEAFLNVDFTNYLTSTAENFEISLEAIDNSLEILSDPVVYTGVMETNQTISSQNQIRVRVSNSIANFGLATVRVVYKQDNYQIQEFISLAVNPSYLTVAKNNIRTSITSEGTIGYHGFDGSDDHIGEGFVFNETHTLYELGLMYTGNNKIVNAVRSTNNNYDKDFRRITPALPIATDEEGKFVYQASFSDADAGSSRLSINTTQNTLVWNNEGAKDFVIVEYVFENTTNTAINNFYAGLYGDWDIDENTSGANQAVVNSTQNIVFISAPNTNLPKVGLAVLEDFVDKATYSVVSNDPNYSGTPYGLYDGFTDSEKIQALKGTTPTQIGTTQPTDVSVTISAGPYTIPARGKRVIAFVLVGGNTEQEINASVAKANELYTPSVESDEGGDEVTGIEENELTRNIRLYPNPTSNEVRIDASALQNTQAIELQILNVLGQTVQTTSLGQGETVLNVSQLPAGQYILRFDNGKLVGTKRLVIK